MARQTTKPKLPPMPSLSLALPIQLLRARESVMAWFRPHLKDYNLTDHQWRVLRALAEAEVLEMQELSTICEVHPPSLSRIVPKMVDLDYIKRDSDPEDQRRILVTLTPTGKKLVDKVSKGSVEIYRILRETVGSEEISDLQTSLTELIDKLDRARLAAENDQVSLGKVEAGSPRRA